MPRSLEQRAALAGAVLLLLAATQAAFADPVGDFYSGKTMTLIVGSDPGGGYDAHARLVARHLGRFIPGNPTILVQNMPGAGSVLMTNRIVNVAPKDGTVLGLVQRGILTSQLLEQPGLHYEVDKLNWIGSVTSETSVFIVNKDVPVSNLADLRHTEILVGGTGATSDQELTAKLLNTALGTKLKIISGYAGTNDVILAMERGELQGISLSWSNVKLKKLQDKTKMLLQIGNAKEPDLPDVPLAYDSITDPANRKVAEIFFGQLALARPILSAPEFPPDRLAAVRKAFMEMVGDRQFRADAEKAKLEVRPADYQAVNRFVALTTSVTPEVKKRLFAVFGVKG
jgi:tripartite-type tricarboxylate transporter receptor subunit TctC